MKYSFGFVWLMTFMSPDWEEEERERRDGESKGRKQWEEKERKDEGGKEDRGTN